jgi:glycosyl hydrolase family 113
MDGPQPEIRNPVALSTPTNSESRLTWVRTWLTCLAFYYPFLWLSVSLNWSGPALIRMALFRHRLNSVEVTFLVLALTTSPPKGQSAFHQPSAGAALLLPILQVVLVLAVVLLIVLASRRQRSLGGLGIATFGSVALAFEIANFFFARQRRWVGVLEALVYFGVLCFGLRRMLNAWPIGRRASSYWWRLGSLVAGFVVLPGLTALILVLFHHFGPWSGVLVVEAPVVGAGMLVSLWRQIQSPDVQQPKWGHMAIGAALSLTVALGPSPVGKKLERARRAAEEKVLAGYPSVDPTLPYPQLFFQRGVNVSVEQMDGYASEEGREILQSLPQYGVDAVALIPYGFTRRGSPPSIVTGSMESDFVMKAGARIAHARGMKVMLKPAIWNAFDLDFASAGERAAWFVEYAKFIEHYANLAKETHADIFCVGGELTHLTQYDAEWRKLIGQVRRTYPGPLVYAANFGDEFEHLQFWDALDYIGLQEYYPLPDDLSTDSVVRKVEDIEEKFQKPVIFTEVGFPSVEGGNRKPWDDSQGKNISVRLQASCYEAIFRAFYQKPWFYGMYWWKIGTDGEGGPDDVSLTPWQKPAMDVVKQWYLHGGR